MTTIYDSHAVTADERQSPTSQYSLKDVQQSSEQCVREHPLSSVAVAVGVGAAVGLVAAVMLTSGEDRRRRSMMAQLGQQMSNRFGQYLPDSIYSNR